MHLWPAETTLVISRCTANSTLNSPDGKDCPLRQTLVICLHSYHRTVYFFIVNPPF